MTDNEPGLPWEMCQATPDCKGVRYQGREVCLAHLAEVDPPGFARALTQIGANRVVDARGMTITADLLDQILKPFRDRSGDSPGLISASFDRSIFESSADLGIKFEGQASFTGATFIGHVSFQDAWFARSVFLNDSQFQDGAWFMGAKFSEDAIFERAQFTGEVHFGGAQFGFAVFDEAHFIDEADFTVTQFNGRALFLHAQFNGDAHFDEAQFTRMANFLGAQFNGRASFIEAKFTGDAIFGEAQVIGDAAFTSALFTRHVYFEETFFASSVWFDGANFEFARKLGPMLVLGGLSLDAASFLQNIDIDVSADRLTCAQTKFRDGVGLGIRWAEISLEEADFPSPSVLAKGLFKFEVLDESALEDMNKGKPLRSARPRLVSLRRASVGNLLLSNVDLRACRFVNSHGLDQLRLEGDAEFATTPGAWRWTRRQTLAEEQQWRRNQGVRGNRDEPWYQEECQPPDWLMEGQQSELERPLPPQHIASIYRALRKGREDNKDEPGAADFYYGEMEMRRHSRARRLERGAEDQEEEYAFERIPSRGERVVLWVYWLVSGYGLRASRALLCLLLTVGIFALLLDLKGFEPDESFGEALLFSAQSTTSLLRAPESAMLTTVGAWANIILRLLGPLFFGLTLLSLRGRVKR